MKRMLVLSMLMVTAFSFCSEAQPSPRVSAEGKDVKVEYGQPSKKGRNIFGELVPFDKVWRAGANQGTEITFAKDATFGGKAIKAGSYTLFVQPTADNWTIFLNPELKQPGSFGYDKIKDKNVLEVQVPVKKTGSPVEKLTYRFADNNNLIIEWDETQVEVPIQVQG